MQRMSIYMHVRLPGPLYTQRCLHNSDCVLPNDNNFWEKIFVTLNCASGSDQKVLQFEHLMHTAGASGSDVTEIVTVQEEGLLVKELSSASCAQAQHVSNSGKDRFHSYLQTLCLCCHVEKKLIIHLHVTLNVGILGIKVLLNNLRGDYELLKGAIARVCV